MCLGERSVDSSNWIGTLYQNCPSEEVIDWVNDEESKLPQYQVGGVVKAYLTCGTIYKMNHPTVDQLKAYLAQFKKCGVNQAQLSAQNIEHVAEILEAICICLEAVHQMSPEYPCWILQGLTLCHQARFVELAKPDFNTEEIRQIATAFDSNIDHGTVLKRIQTILSAAKATYLGIKGSATGWDVSELHYVHTAAGKYIVVCDNCGKDHFSTLCPVKGTDG